MSATTRHGAAVAGLVLVSALAACGTTHENAPGAASAGAPPARACQGTGGKYTIGMSQANLSEPYRVRMDDDIRRAAAGVGQFTVHFADAAQDNAKQVEQVNTFLTQNIDLLIISPNEATPLTAVVHKAYAQGIPVLVLDRKVDGEGYTSFIGADNVDIGRQAGRFFADTLLPHGGKVVELRGLAGSTPAKERSAGFDQGIAGHGITVAGTADADWLRDKGQQQADALLKAHPDAQALFSANDPMAEGARIAAQNAGRADLPITGIDGLPVPEGGIKAVEAGRLSATFVYPTGGAEAIAAAKKLLLDCRQVPKQQTLPTRLVTRADAAQVYTDLNRS
ncbi:monosaccharide ABC transporter substrate-binding protein (CUT2 family) [Amycolatopsis sulphurea]|uniref:Monosaccharide ABC transporter substrate-binding protein (CUT2 family) n=1 Tax=Amycolatopsis sulphurea TaxID=76022 RepID=A0A2A9G0U4_9PSEU|nr:substrate-binding domain-containing protein [Amycolatopsis sulphurea]PFG56783.1 monosaccharide ABC transporter substrate-binding protein (CUT2 family) [Amycolatopsis sulphurea]